MANVEPAGSSGIQKGPPLAEEEAFIVVGELKRALNNANLLLGYAAEAGITVPPDLVDAILTAQVAGENCTKSQLVAFHTAFTKLANSLNPVTADTIRACAAPEAARTLRRNRIWAVVLTIVILILSIVTFIDSSIATKLTSDISDTNAVAVKLRTALGPLAASVAPEQCDAIRTPVPPPHALTIDDLTQLQQFAAALRDVYGKSIKLDYFVAKVEKSPLTADAGKSARWIEDRLQLNPAMVNYEAEIVCKISTYEQVRNFAQNILLDNAVALGALAAYVLPIAYALLGAMAFRLRTFADTIRKRTYHPSYADSARLIAAVIAGAIISLFNTFTQGITLSPLAVAFLIGYGVEIFYTFLDTILTSFGSAGTARLPGAR